MSKKNNPDSLPPGFFKDRQDNSRDSKTITYFINNDKMKGMDEVRFYKKVIRKAIPGVRKPGLKVIPRPNEVFVHSLPAALKSTVKNIEKSLKPDQTTMVDIVLRRLVHEGVYELTTDLTADNFRKQKPKDIIG